MKKEYEESFGQLFLTASTLWPFLEKCDADFAEVCRQAGCIHCGGRLHQANFQRKPRGVEFDPSQIVRRHSFCCEKEGCRKRHTPASVRFLGRRVYVGFVVLLVSAMRHGLTPKRLHALRQRLILNIDRRTLERWRQWWLNDFAQSSFWNEVRARFMPPLCQRSLPLSLCVAFEIERRDRLLELLKFLRPLTISSLPC